MLKSFVKVFIVCVLIFLQIVKASERKNLAVFDFVARGVTKAEAAAITDRIRIEVARFEIYIVVERGMMEEILKEQAFQLSGACSESSCLVEVGQLLAVHYIIGGSVSKVGSLFTIEARVVDVESGKIVKNVIEDYSGPIENLLVYTTKTVAKILVGISKETEAVELIGTSDLLVKSNPPGATIYLNDKPVGDVTPYTIQGLLEAEYRVKVKKRNLVEEKVVSIGKKEIKEVLLNLEPEKFLIRIYSKPSDADAYVNNIKVGKTPVDYTVSDTTADFLIEIRRDMYRTKVDTVRFEENPLLRLNYRLSPCGRIVIQDIEDVDVYINDKPSRQYLTLSKPINILSDFRNSLLSNEEGKSGYILFSKSNLIVDQLNFGKYSLRMEKQYHKPFEKTVLLTETSPVKSIVPNFERLTGSLQIINNSALVNGEIKGREFYQTFQIDKGNKIDFEIPYGSYSIQARAKGYFSFRRDLKLYSSKTRQIRIQMMQPEHIMAKKLAFLFPGAGQIYSIQHGKGLIFSISVIGGLAWGFRSLDKYNSELNNYNRFLSNYVYSENLDDMDRYRNLANESRDKLDSYRIKFFSALGLSALSYISSLIDITWFFPYKNDKRDVSLKYENMENENVISLQYSVGF